MPGSSRPGRGGSGDRVARRVQPRWSGTTRGSREPRPCGLRWAHNSPSPIFSFTVPAQQIPAPRWPIGNRSQGLCSPRSSSAVFLVPTWAGRRWRGWLYPRRRSPGAEKALAKVGATTLRSPDIAFRGRAPKSGKRPASPLSPPDLEGPRRHSFWAAVTGAQRDQPFFCSLTAPPRSL